MTTENLQNLISQFDESELKAVGFFGVYKNHHDMDDCYIKANKEGLLIFALQLLKAADQVDTILAHKEKSEIQLGFDEEWMDTRETIFLEYIEPISSKPEMAVQKAPSSTIRDKFFTCGCGMGLIILLIAVLVGLATMFSWLF